VFFVIIFSIWFVFHLYVWLRIVRPARLPRPWKAAAWLAVWTAYAMVPLLFLTRLIGHKPSWYGPLFWVAFTLAGFTLILFPLTLAKDAAALAARGLWRALGRGRNPRPDPARRRFIINAMNLGVLGMAGVMTGAGFVQARKTPPVKRVDVPIPGLNPGLDGLTIAHITDTHVSPTIHGDYLRAVVERVNALSPDMISFTGDMVDGLVDEMKNDVAPIAGLSAPLGVYFVTGNHEYYWDLQGWLSEVARHGLITLNNEHRTIERGGATLVVAGVTDYSAGRHHRPHESDPARALAGAPDADMTIMLAHQPRSAPDVAKAGADLQLSGHTHGGQIFPWSLFVPLIHPVPPGLSRFRGMWVYVSRGSGYWGPPVRLGAPSEITLLTLRRAPRPRPAA